jgi:hypothetical protein
MNAIVLDDRHIFDTFDCGVLALDEWLKRRPRANAMDGASGPMWLATAGNRNGAFDVCEKVC